MGKGACGRQSAAGALIQFLTAINRTSPAYVSFEIPPGRPLPLQGCAIKLIRQILKFVIPECSYRESSVFTIIPWIQGLARNDGY